MIRITIKDDVFQSDIRRIKRVINREKDFFKNTKIAEESAKVFVQMIWNVLESQEFPKAKAAGRYKAPKSKSTGRFVKSAYLRWKRNKFPETAHLYMILTRAMQNSFEARKISGNNWEVRINPSAAGYKGVPVVDYAGYMEDKSGFFEYTYRKFLSEAWPGIVRKFIAEFDARSK